MFCRNNSSVIWSTRSDRMDEQILAIFLKLILNYTLSSTNVFCSNRVRGRLVSTQQEAETTDVPDSRLKRRSPDTKSDQAFVPRSLQKFSRNVCTALGTLYRGQEAFVPMFTCPPADAKNTHVMNSYCRGIVDQLVVWVFFCSAHHPSEDQGQWRAGETALVPVETDWLHMPSEWGAFQNAHRITSNTESISTYGKSLHPYC